MSYPKISCVCPTFSRAYLLEEAIESFHKQDYLGEKELIICNDFTRQNFVYEHPDVKVINLSERCPNLGSKRNKAYSYATGDIFLTWGDDDIHLPKRISRMVNSMISQKSEFLFEGPYYILYAGKIEKNQGRTSGAHAITKELFYKIGGIPEINSGEDQAFNRLVEKKIGNLSICKEEPQFLYRFSNTNRVHISQFGIDKSRQKSGYEIFLENAIRYVDEGKEPNGIYELKPHWSKDWVNEVSNIK